MSKGVLLHKPAMPLFLIVADAYSRSQHEFLVAVQIFMPVSQIAIIKVIGQVFWSTLF